MTAEEPYDSASVAALAGSTQSAAFFLDTNSVACGYDFNHRDILYVGTIIPSLSTSAGGSFVNTTGYKLFNGASKWFTVGSTIVLADNCFSPQVYRKNIDTGVVTAFPTYSASATVPANVGGVYPYVSNQGSGYTHASVSVTGGGGTGMTAVALVDPGGSGRVLDVHVKTWGSGYDGTQTFSISGDGTSAAITVGSSTTPSDGTARWIGASYGFNQGLLNGPNLVNPRNGDFWVSSASCELYQYRSADSFAQTLAPWIVADVSNPFNGAIPYPVGIDATWCYCFGKAFDHDSIFLAIIPSSITSDETTAASKLAYAMWLSAPFSFDSGARATFDTLGNLYVLSLEIPGGSNPFTWRLTEYAPPTLTSYGSNAVGTMTDLTSSLWDTSGPNADGANYDLGGGLDLRGSLRFSLCRLPATNQMAAVLKFPKENSSSPTDYTKTLFSCLYVTFGASPSWDYHSGFVTGYMNASWVSVGTIPTTGYAVVDGRETNNHLEQSDYVYSGVDYTRRWFIFQCYPIVAGSVVTTNGLMDVFVEYHFVSGSAPAVVSPPGVLNDTQWSSNYTAYQSAISEQNAVYNSTVIGTVAQGSANMVRLNYIYPDPGIYDTTTNSFWFSGLTDPFNAPSALSANNMFYLDSTFTPRAAFNAPGQPNADFGTVSPPLLKLSFVLGPTPKGHLHTRPFFDR